jgi:hypothetical protein
MLYDDEKRRNARTYFTMLRYASQPSSIQSFMTARQLRHFSIDQRKFPTLDCSQLLLAAIFDVSEICMACIGDKSQRSAMPVVARVFDRVLGTRIVMVILERPRGLEHGDGVPCHQRSIRNQTDGSRSRINMQDAWSCPSLRLTQSGSASELRFWVSILVSASGCDINTSLLPSV